MRAAATSGPMLTETVPGPDATATPEPAAATADVEVDVDGMPYDPEIHASTKTKTQDGKWKSRQGKADEAKAAREAFLSAGGNVTPPTNLPDTPVAESAVAPAAQVAPAAEAPAATAGEVVQMPGAFPAPTLPASAPADITYEKVGEKLMGMIRRGSLDQNTQYPDLLKKVGVPLDDPNTPLQNDPALRAALYAELCAIEPEMA